VIRLPVVWQLLHAPLVTLADIDVAAPGVPVAVAYTPDARFTAPLVRKLPLPSAVSVTTALPPPAASVVSVIVAPGYTVVPSGLYAVPAIAKLWQPRQSRPALWLVASDVPGAVVVGVVVEPDDDVVGLAGELPPQPAASRTAARAKVRADVGASLFMCLPSAKRRPASFQP
jgi:hypothetical protein